MASRIAEVVYKLRDLFTGPARNVEGGYEGIRRESRRAADSVQRDNQRMSGSFAALGRGVKAAAAAFAGAFAGRATISTVNELADELDRLGKTAARLDIDPNTLSALEFAAERSGVAVEKMVASISTLQKRTGEAAEGLGIARAAFDKLGISVDEFIALDAEQQLIIIADRIRALATEEERAAVVAQLFSKQNSDMLQLLNAGGQSLKELVQRGKEYRNITREQTEAAAAYNDALSNINRQLDGIKFDVFTPVIREVSEFLDNIGQGDQLKGLTTELLLLENRLKKPFVLFRGDVEQRVREIRAEIKRLTDERKKAQEVDEKEQAARQAQAEATRQYNVELEQLTDSYEAQTKAQKANLDQQTRELQAARSQQASIEKEFKSLVDNITAPDIEDVGLVDVFLKIREASNAANKGQADEAIALARQGGDLLGLLKSKGTETQGTLKFLAEQLQGIATKAAEQNTQAEIIDVEQAQASLDGVSNRLFALKSDAVKAGDELGKAFVASIQTAIDQAPALTGPAMPAPTPQIVREGNSFSHSVRREVNRRGGK